jgi:hypothetical protein
MQTPKSVSNYTMKNFKEANSFNNFVLSDHKDENESIGSGKILDITFNKSNYIIIIQA